LKLVQEIGQSGRSFASPLPKIALSYSLQVTTFGCDLLKPLKGSNNHFFLVGNWGKDIDLCSAFQLWNTQKTRFFATQQPYSTQSDQARHASHRSLGH
jgi:hypothetical protein